MGKAVDWQSEAARQLEDYHGTLLNPRRADWDTTWEQTVDNPNFKEQVNWELDGLEKADFILFHFEPETLSPITFGEFAAYYKQDNIYVSCPKGWWRRGNIEVMCDREHIYLHDSLDETIAHLKMDINYAKKKVRKE